LSKILCPHCGAENPQSLIVTTCHHCRGSLEGAQPTEAPVPPPPVPIAPLPSDLGVPPEEPWQAAPTLPPPSPPEPAPLAPPSPPSLPAAALPRLPDPRSGQDAAKTGACCACSGVLAAVAGLLAIIGLASGLIPLVVIAVLMGLVGAIAGLFALRKRVAAGYYETTADAAPAVGLGDSAQWGVTITARRPMTVGAVSCTLSCQEHAISRGGTSDSHYRKTLFTQTFQLAGGSLQPGQQASFRVPFTIPPDGVPSHRSANNFIEWRLELHAPVPGMCPDIKQKVDLWVAPTVRGELTAGLPDHPSVAAGWMRADRLTGGQAQLGSAWGALQSQDGAMIDQSPAMCAGETRNLYLWVQTGEPIACRGVWAWVGCRIHGSGTDEEIPLMAERLIHEGAVQPGTPVGCPIQVTIPAQGPVSFAGRYVKLEWVARVRFDIPLWFDKRMWVPIIVTPRRLPEPDRG